ncbi:hypothetical protein FHS27_003884 [Rhodopirellula rubra]|uniref:Uncharacterized protein n=1 Tax=Aporhodopirellula rubra TaxID=980271 RepID=A0A7W5H610_9BACT|nr:hypothetical protein [Aporhodopirellula rubra]
MGVTVAGAMRMCGGVGGAFQGVRACRKLGPAGSWSLEGVGSKRDDVELHEVAKRTRRGNAREAEVCRFFLLGRASRGVFGRAWREGFVRGLLYRGGIVRYPRSARTRICR